MSNSRTNINVFVLKSLRLLLWSIVFADDTFLCAQNRDLSALATEVNQELNKVADWLSSNQLTLNVGKSKYMIISNKKNISNISLYINSSKLEECDNYK